MERQLGREKKEVGTDRCIQHKTIDRQKEIVRQRGGGGSYCQVDVYNIKHWVDREIVRYRAGGGSYRLVDVYNKEQQIEREIVRQRGG